MNEIDKSTSSKLTKLLSNVIASAAEHPELSVEQIQTAYDIAFKLSRKVFGTSSPTIALCNYLGLDFSRREIQHIREYLYSIGVKLRNCDKQCADPETKARKSKAQIKVRATEDPEKKIARVNKIKQSRWDKPQEELDEIQCRQIENVKKTIYKQMENKENWKASQDERQKKAMIKREEMTEEKKAEGIEKWKQTYWNKTDEERAKINAKRAKSGHCYFYEQGILFHSTYERNMYFFLKEHNIEFQYHILACKLHQYTWYTDFYIPSLNMILETKGKHPKYLRYWKEITLPKIIEARLFETYDIRINWDRNLQKYKCFEDVLRNSEKIAGKA